MTSADDFLKELEGDLWKAADKLRSSLDAANYKHIVLSLLFLKYASDSFAERQRSLEASLRDKDHDDYIDPEIYDSAEEYEALIKTELEERDYYLVDNVMWVPPKARWEYIRETAPSDEDKTPAEILDDALQALESENEKLKGILGNFSRYQLPDDKLIELINLFSETQFRADEELNLTSRDILGHVYEYFLGEFALAEGKQGGQYFTPKSIVALIVEMLEPYFGKIYDPAAGSGGFFVGSDNFIAAHADNKHYKPSEQRKEISIYGQESNPTTWKLAAMNLVIRGLDFNFGSRNADSFFDDLHPDLRADYVMANPPFNMDDWGGDKLEEDARWKHGTPPASNANFAWLQHMLYHLGPTGSMALLLANGSMSSASGGEDDIRKNMVEEDLVECMVALPGQLFTNTQIPACIWLLTKNKEARKKTDRLGKDYNGKRDRKGEVLFIDARSMGHMKTRVVRDFSKDDRNKIAGCFHAWQKGENYQNEPGFCFSAKLEDIAKQGYVLTPGRYVGAPEQEEDNEVFAEKMARLTAELKGQLQESDDLEKQVRANMKSLGFDI